jgi:DNA adenine methylase
MENETMIKPDCLVPPLKWHGGKHYLAKHILGLMPRHLHYVEAFFGGGQVLFARDPADLRLWWQGPCSDGRKPDGVSELVNDIDGDLMNLYAVLKDQQLFEELRRRLELTLFAQPEWEAARDLLAQPGDCSVERAAALFTFCRQSLAGRMKGFATPVRTRLRGGRNDGVNAWWNAIDGLEAVQRRLRNVMILNKDAVAVIRSEDGPATLFYCDPPYLHETRTAQNVYKHEMSEAQHVELLEALLKCRGKVILSGYANRLYDGMLHNWKRHTFDLPNNAARGKQKERETEVLWCNF